TIPSSLRRSIIKNSYRWTTPVIPETDEKPLSPLMKTEMTFKSSRGVSWRSARNPRRKKPVDRAQPAAPLTRSDITDLLAALRSTNEMLQQQGPRISALEESIHSKRSRSRSPRRIRPRSKTPPPRCQDTHNR
ncbi:hypothetical protein A2U01_0057725, partial [Trifolium medium]|nr:hypothetical protein [Trifolium medium]